MDKNGDGRIDFEELISFLMDSNLSGLLSKFTTNLGVSVKIIN